MTTKEEARRLFLLHGLESLPTKSVSFPNQLDDAFTEHTLLTIRGVAEGEIKNLPRLVGVSHEMAKAFIADNGSLNSFIVQPYEQLVFSAEIALAIDRAYVELVPGIWELDNEVEPEILEISLTGVRTYCPHVGSPLSPGYFLFSGHRRVVHCHLDDTAMRLMTSWLLDKWENLQSLRMVLNQAFLGVKVHFGTTFGFSPQNIRTVLNWPSSPWQEQATGSQSRWDVELAFGELPTTEVDSVLIRGGVSREQGAELAAYAAALRRAGVQRVVLVSGLLSHFAILLREAGLETIRPC